MGPSIGWPRFSTDVRRSTHQMSVKHLPATATPEPRRLACARCGDAFDCGSAVGKCWCAEEEFRLPMPAADSGEDCLCPACLRKLAATPPQPRGGSAR